MADFSRVTNSTGYSMKQHLADVNPHPQYVLNNASAVAAVIDEYLSDHPVTVTGSIDDLSNVTITSPADGQLLTYDATSGQWVNRSISDIGINEVIVNGENVVVDGIANIPAATSQVYGVTRLATTAEVNSGSSDSVAVTPAQVSAMLSTFKSTQTGAITIYIGDGVGQWQIDGGAWYNSGALADNLPAGTHIINFSNVNGYEQPEALTVNVVGGCVITLIQNYTPTTGSLTVHTNGAMLAEVWSIDNGTTWYDNGETVTGLAPGVYTVILAEDVTLNTADPVQVTLGAGQNLDIAVEYPAISSKITVQLNNAPSGAQWSLDSSTGPWYNSGVTLDGLTVGTHIVYFKEVSGYTTPEAQTVVATRDGHLIVSASYYVSDYAIYGVRYVKGETASDPTLTGVIVNRDTGVKKLLGPDEPWPELPAHDFRKCVVNTSTGRVNYYLDPSNSAYKLNGTYRGVTSAGGASTLTGGDGEVLVEILPVYFRVDYVGLDENNEHIYDWLISRHQFEGSVLHPFFYVGRDSAVDNRVFTQYIGAYESVLATLSSGVKGAGITTSGITTPNAYTAGTRCCRSIKGFKPVTNMTLAQFREAHVAAGLHTMNTLAMQFIALMMFIEYRSLDSQDSGVENFDIDRGCIGNRSDGFVWYNASFAYAYVRPTGRADYFGNGSGEVEWSSSIDSSDLPDNFASGSTNGKKVVGFTYRGIENPFGHIFKFEDGILTSANGYYITQTPSLYTSDLTTAQSTYAFIDHVWPSSGYIKFFTFTQEDPSFFAEEVGGSSTTYLPDYFGAVFTTVATEIKMLRRAVWTGTGEVLKAADIGITSIETWPRNNSNNIGSRSAYSIVFDED